MKIQIKGVERSIHDSSGNLLALDLNGQRAFWEFYRDGPVDDLGRPLVLYHGTSEEFSTFRTLGNTGQGDEFVLDGAFFAEDHNAAIEFGEQKGGWNVKHAYVALQTPLIVEMFDDGEGIESDWRNPMAEQEVILAARATDRDGVIFKSSMTGERYFVAFHSSQIIEATSGPVAVLDDLPRVARDCAKAEEIATKDRPGHRFRP